MITNDGLVLMAGCAIAHQRRQNHKTARNSVPYSIRPGHDDALGGWRAGKDALACALRFIWNLIRKRDAAH
jgi:hypothetical protein